MNEDAFRSIRLFSHKVNFLIIIILSLVLGIYMAARYNALIPFDWGAKLGIVLVITISLLNVSIVTLISRNLTTRKNLFKFSLILSIAYIVSGSVYFYLLTPLIGFLVILLKAFAYVNGINTESVRLFLLSVLKVG